MAGRYLKALFIGFLISGFLYSSVLMFGLLKAEANIDYPQLVWEEKLDGVRLMKVRVSSGYYCYIAKFGFRSIAMDCR